MKIGYTTGVFDLFHVGHLNILKASKGLCDYLIVGVTTDEEVYRLKSIYPFIPFEERIEIVKSIKYVDEVVVEDDSNKILAWEKIKFNIMFKGDDWKKSEKFEMYKEIFDKKGVEIHFFPYTKTTSSTKLRDLIDSKISNRSDCNE